MQEVMELRKVVDNREVAATYNNAGGVLFTIDGEITHGVSTEASMCMVNRLNQVSWLIVRQQRKSDYFIVNFQDDEQFILRIHNGKVCSMGDTEEIPVLELPEDYPETDEARIIAVAFAATCEVLDKFD